MNIRVDIPMIEAAAALLAPYRDDDDLYHDMIEGETDALELLDALLEQIQHDEDMGDVLDRRISEMKARAERFRHRADARKKIALHVLHAAGLKKAELPAATVSIRAGSVSVQITDEADIPTQLMREKITSAPDKTAIKAQIEAGEHVPGAELVRGAETLSVRVK